MLLLLFCKTQIISIIKLFGSLVTSEKFPEIDCEPFVEYSGMSGIRIVITYHFYIIDAIKYVL